MTQSYCFSFQNNANQNEYLNVFVCIWINIHRIYVRCNVQYNNDIAQIGGAIYGFRSAKTGKEPDFALYTWRWV